jgi:hypothetical protein
MLIAVAFCLRDTAVWGRHDFICQIAPEEKTMPTMKLELDWCFRTFEGPYGWRNRRATANFSSKLSFSGA